MSFDERLTYAKSIEKNGKDTRKQRSEKCTSIDELLMVDPV